jgi:hypothetical protein
VIENAGNLLHSLVRELLRRISPDWTPLDEAVQEAGSVPALFETWLDNRMFVGHRGVYCRGQLIAEPGVISGSCWPIVLHIDPETNRIHFLLDGRVVVTAIDVKVEPKALRKIFGKFSAKRSDTREAQYAAYLRANPPGKLDKAAWSRQAAKQNEWNESSVVTWLSREEGDTLWREMGGKSERSFRRDGYFV